MGMDERRNAKRGKWTAAGNVELELREIQKLQRISSADGKEALTVPGSGISIGQETDDNIKNGFSGNGYFLQYPETKESGKA